MALRSVEGFGNPEGDDFEMKNTDKKKKKKKGAKK